jgi:molybdopterin/thiamine biosynthesis adenylyltransferase
MNNSLQKKRALLVGMGGLGAPASLVLARAGVGVLGLSDSDCVDLSNLHRQILYRTEDIGEPKTSIAAKRLKAMFPAIQTEELPALSAENMLKEVARWDIILDGTDSIETKFLLSDIVVQEGLTLVHAGVVQHRGLLTTIAPGGPCYRCFFEAPPPPGEIVTCQDAGILGAAAGFVAGFQAKEALRILLGHGPSLSGTLLTIDLKNFRMREIPFGRNPACLVCKQVQQKELS